MFLRILKYIYATIAILFTCNAIADSTFGMSIFASSFDNAPTKNSNQTISNGYGKTSMILYGQSSFAKNTRLLTVKTEVLNLQRKEYTINGYTFPQITNSGIRSLEIMGSQYLLTSGGWKTFIVGGYNTKGVEANTDLRFALPRSEYLGGIMLLKTSKYGDSSLSSILTNMLQISEKRIYQININNIYGLGYRAIESFGMVILPLRHNTNLKILGKSKHYIFDRNAPVFFQNESKVMLGLILKGPSHHSIEFSLYYDNIIKEKGVSLSYLYFFEHRKTNSFTKVTDRLKTRYQKPQTVQKKSKEIKTTDQESIKNVVRETLEEMGY